MMTRRQLRFESIPPVMVILTGVLLLQQVVWAGDQKLPADIDSSLGYLYEFADPQTTAPFEVSRIEKLMAFVLNPKERGTSSAGRSGAFLDPLAYHEFTIKRSLSFTLEYAHNPDIPPQILTLATVRFAQWKTFDERHPNLPDVVEHLQSIQEPFVIRGLEHEEIAPDASSGAYYSYDLQRTMIGFRHGMHTVWLSMSRQADKSDVGRKGYVLDEDNSWHYLYSGEKGITKKGLGWVDSFMYDGWSCNFLIQSDDQPDQVKVAIFKWLHAGWKDMNFVKYKHIRDGLEHYGATLRQILENPALPAPSEIEAVQKRINDMSIAQLRQINRDYLLALDKHFGDKQSFPRSWFKKQVVKGDYIDRLTRPQLEAVVFLEYMNGVLGMQRVTDSEVLVGSLQISEP